MNFQFVATQCNYAALVREAFAIYMSIKRLSFNLQDVECTILCDCKPLEQFLKGNTENSEVNNRSIQLLSYQLSIQGINITENVLVDCLSCLVDAKLIHHACEPKGQEFGKHLFREIPPHILHHSQPQHNTYHRGPP